MLDFTRVLLYNKRAKARKIQAFITLLCFCYIFYMRHRLQSKLLSNLNRFIDKRKAPEKEPFVIV